MTQLKSSQVSLIAIALRVAASRWADTETPVAGLDAQFRRQAAQASELAEQFEADPRVLVQTEEEEGDRYGDLQEQAQFERNYTNPE
ncbi:MAG: hypothetical protein K2X43_01140 [Hyphomonadaceae bacterium]|jgi:hypothetical protein|nr:hypothetical protein [Hyphomonadaceae bacterium]